MSGVNTQVRDALDGSGIPEIVSQHKWVAFGIGTTTFWLIWGFLLDLIGWNLAGGVTAAFAVIWLLNIIFVWCFLQIIRISIERLEA